MTTYATGNPLGSKDPRDLYDNAENFDTAMNDRANVSWNDRFGVSRKTWFGVEQQVNDFLANSGFELPPLQYVDGSPLTVDRPTQLIERDGNLYSIRLPANFPVTLSGNWTADEPLLAVRSDQSLRQQLAGADGADMVGHNGVTVGSALDSLSTNYQDLSDEVLKNKSQYSLDKLDQFRINAKALNSVTGFWPISDNQWSVRCVNILGDSISFGADASEIGRDSYVGILRRMLNNEFGAHNYGFVSVKPDTSNAYGTYKEIHEFVGQTGNLYYPQLSDLDGTINGMALGATTEGSTVSVRIPITYTHVAFWYDGTKVGVIDVLVNGSVVQTITSTGSGVGWERSTPVDVSASGMSGRSTFTVRFTSGTPLLLGFDFCHSASGEFRLNNFSRDGRQGRRVSQSVIDAACSGSYFTIWALGVNDQNSTGAELDAYKQRIDWLIQSATNHRTRLVVLDLLFQKSDSNPVRAELRRAASSVAGSIYLPVANIFSPDGSVLSEAELTRLNLANGVHPTEVGHRLIAETLSAMLGLSCTSKRQALVSEVNFTPLLLEGGLLNATAASGYFSGYRMNGGQVSLILRITTVPTSGTVLGTMNINSLLPQFDEQIFLTRPDGAGNSGIIRVSPSGVVTFLKHPNMTLPTSIVLNATWSCFENRPWF
ncbi:SGNH/GDSL hydrolase family protein [Pseudomonas aeruginosa]|uniref:SGNH/GDSL hydrolase family protein n=1 Tax=Pseudomonas aeruginosa TaxID=287 RepID=UPI00164357D2|nr:hypothetical protein [Pseudomonas aeruginosa]